MNREIVFRGKRLDNGEWAYGDLTHDIIGVDVTSYYVADFRVHPDTVGQYTGLKDCNGNEIYEGDILEVAVTKERTIHKQVYWNEKVAAWFVSAVGLDGVTEPLMFSNGAECTVVDNVFDDPELLKGGKQ